MVSVSCGLCGTVKGFAILGLGLFDFDLMLLVLCSGLVLDVFAFDGVCLFWIEVLCVAGILHWCYFALLWVFALVGVSVVARLDARL